jgi:hypothetical protein
MIYCLLVFFTNATVWAHGNMLEQAEGSTAACLRYMLDTEPKSMVRLFKSVHTEVTGNEIFSVAVTLRDARELIFQATGVESTNPDGTESFRWDCKKL